MKSSHCDIFLLCAALAAQGHAQPMMGRMHMMGMMGVMGGQPGMAGGNLGPDVPDFPATGESNVPPTIAGVMGKAWFSHPNLPIPFNLPDLPFPFPGLPQLFSGKSLPPLEDNLAPVPIQFPFAPPDFALYKNCHVDRETFCADLPPPYTVRSLFSEHCMIDNVEELSTECRAMFDAFQRGPEDLDAHVNQCLVGDCDAEKERLCAGVPIGPGPWALFTASCMAMHRDELSPKCRAAFDAFTEAHTNGGVNENYVPSVHVEIIRLPFPTESGDSGMEGDAGLVGEGLVVEVIQDGKTDDSMGAEAGILPGDMGDSPMGEGPMDEEIFDEGPLDEDVFEEEPMGEMFEEEPLGDDMFDEGPIDEDMPEEEQMEDEIDEEGHMTEVEVEEEPMDDEMGEEEPTDEEEQNEGFVGEENEEEEMQDGAEAEDNEFSELPVLPVEMNAGTGDSISKASTTSELFDQSTMERSSHTALAVILAIAGATALLSVMLALAKTRRAKHSAVQRALVESSQAALVSDKP